MRLYSNIVLKVKQLYNVNQLYNVLGRLLCYNPSRFMMTASKRLTI